MDFFKKRVGRNQKAFTLIELLVVISIIGMLSSIVLISLNSVRAKARDAVRMSDIRQIDNAIQLYIANNNKVPPGIITNYSAGDIYQVSDHQWNNDAAPEFVAALQPYLTKIPSDPCGASCPGAAYLIGPWYSYQYRAVPDTTRYQIYAQALESSSGFFGQNHSDAASIVISSPDPF